MLEVVSTVVVRSGRVLLTQRDPAVSDYGWKWETPGGKVEPGELHADAVARELREELNLTARAVDLQPWFVVALGHLPKPVRISFFCVDVGNAQPTLLSGIGMGWFNAVEIAALDLAPGNVVALNKIRGLLLASEFSEFDREGG